MTLGVYITKTSQKKEEEEPVLLTRSVFARDLECSPRVMASSRLSASLYVYSSDLARNSAMLRTTNTHVIRQTAVPVQWYQQIQDLRINFLNLESAGAY